MSRSSLAWASRIDAYSGLGPWGNKWGNMPHKFQPISTWLDLVENCLKPGST
jgi:hypothetical protein